MKISKEKFPILDILRMSKEDFAIKNPLIYGMPAKYVVKQDDWSGVENIMSNNIEGFGELMGGDIDVVSKSFMNDVLLNTSMYKKIDFEEALLEKEAYGVLLFNHTGVAYLYDFRVKDNWTFTVITNKNIVTTIGYKLNGDYRGVNDIHIVEGEQLSRNVFIERSRQLLVFTLLFKHYAKVETIHVKPKEKVKDPRTKENHLNETDVPINILDCTWFNNIIRNEPFGVKGHFRLQPKKDNNGKWIKEMIYIKPFIKSGYNLKAGKLR